MRRMRITAGAWALSLSLVATAPAAHAQPAATTATAEAYARHMDNGVRLYRSRDYVAALAEFSAAYATRPGPSPLLDEALCWRELFDYPRAIDALERAVSRHADELAPADRRAVDESLRELRALLAFVRVETDPEDAVVSLDGRDVSRGADGRVALSPGPHRVGARANGRVPAEERIVVASGEERTLRFVLAPATGFVRVTARSPTTPIEIDGEVVGRGDFQGPLRVGRHEVRLVGEGTQLSIEVAPGESLDVRGDGVPASARPLPEAPPPPPPPVRRPDPEPRGPFATLAGSLLFPIEPPDEDAGAGLGAAATLRGGFRASSIVAFELLVGGSASSGSGPSDDVDWARSAGRLGAAVRFSTPARPVRLTAGIGAGAMFNALRWDGPGGEIEASGFDPFGALDAGLEVEMPGTILLGAAVEAWLDRISSARTDAGERPFDGDLVLSIGPSVRAGLALW